ncbi:hypothetical protein [Vitiosangium sp. GDMCC 1.1324]|uniref:hypothetical protein n=1 Tax=Vitiosangium sp. (strain GDMCC 1.1324) TaxID=2138576 RepID=UPI000D3D574D|nr:hypothetical protein [Vitiosangium sp. GDMCC 1.1324]PTL78349.1 hypothetical protein DAT35_40605 [Vitiosangium sp. GDMCC 1.1324]
MTTDSSAKTPRILSRRTEIIFLVIYCICFSFGSVVHVMDVVKNGLTMSSAGPVAGTSIPLVWIAINKSFTLFNPLTLVLLLVRRRVGIALMVGITTTVFVMNLELMAQWWLQAKFLHVAWLYLNGSLGVFQLVTAPMMWRTSLAREAQRASPALAA